MADRSLPARLHLLPIQPKRGRRVRLCYCGKRERIARDLHDLLGHTLTVIAVKSDIANRLFSLDPELAHREIADVEATAREALREVRSAVTGYRAEGITAELSNVRSALTSSGVQLFTQVEDIALPAADRNALCFVIREAVTNILRHAHATECHIELSQDNSVRLTIDDNGSGKRGGDGNGIQGMRERLQQVNGLLSVDSSTLGGVRVIAQLPGHSQVLSPDASPTPKASISA
jgi:two-component system sensor histidine kinase DesK